MKKVVSLTKQQEKELILFREKWLQIGLSTDRVDKELTVSVLKDFYKRINKKTPYFWFCDSPFQAQIFINLLKKDGLGDNLEDNLRANLGANLGANLEYIGTDFWGSLDSYWIAHFLFPHQKIRPMHSAEQAGLLSQWAVLAKSCGWFYCYENISFVCDRPNSIKKDDQGRLHNESGAAISFVDGYSVYVWHGTNIPDEWITNKKSITPEIALKWENIEQRRCAAEIVGWENIINALNPVIIDANPNPKIGTLIEVDLPESGKERFLRVQCATNRNFCLPVPREMKTAHQANAMTWGLDPKQYNPSVET